MSDDPHHWSTSEFVQNWFHALSTHRSADDLLPYVVDNGLEMVLPEVTLHGKGDVRTWFAADADVYSDQSHTVEEVVRTDTAHCTALAVTVLWQARQSTDGALINSRTHQSWELVEGPSPQAF